MLSTSRCNVARVAFREQQIRFGAARRTTETVGARRSTVAAAPSKLPWSICSSAMLPNAEEALSGNWRAHATFNDSARANCRCSADCLSKRDEGAAVSASQFGFGGGDRSGPVASRTAGEVCRRRAVSLRRRHAIAQQIRSLEGRVDGRPGSTAVVAQQGTQQVPCGSERRVDRHGLARKSNAPNIQTRLRARRLAVLAKRVQRSRRRLRERRRGVDRAERLSSLAAQRARDLSAASIRPRGPSPVSRNDASSTPESTRDEPDHDDVPARDAGDLAVHHRLHALRESPARARPTSRPVRRAAAACVPSAAAMVDGATNVIADDAVESRAHRVADHATQRAVGVRRSEVL